MSLALSRLAEEDPTFRVETNPETGEIENVLGFDLSGEQGKVAKKAGYKMSPKITTSPMVFIGGGTGGGKSLTTDTIVSVFGKSSEN